MRTQQVIDMRTQQVIDMRTRHVFDMRPQQALDMRTQQVSITILAPVIMFDWVERNMHPFPRNISTLT